MVAQGEAKKQWQFTLTTQPYQPVDKDAGIAPTSPRLQTLAKQLDQQNIQAFWQQIRQEGAPLIEPYDNDKKRVTFFMARCKKECLFIRITRW